MKETIYTIPINEAFDEKCGCAMCNIENRIEIEEIEYTLGPAMMEPDFRINSNDKGFCQKHYKSLLENSKALPLALVLQTHIQQQNKNIFDKRIAKSSKGGVFKKQCDEIISAKNIISKIEKLNNDCIICERVNHTMNRYFDNLIYMWKTQEDFRQKFSIREGFCIPHFSKLLSFAINGLNEREFKDFYHTLINMQEISQKEIYNDISAFTKLFDHNSNTMPTDNVKNSIKRSINKISGLNCEND